ncbi:MAG: Gfo/Idh/MocA family oxidoreductase [bacterium]
MTVEFHCRQTCMALNNGSNVLCEKPVAAVQEVQEMIETRDRLNL